LPSITLKNLPDSLLKTLKARAAERRRSLQQEVVTLLEAGTKEDLSGLWDLDRRPAVGNDPSAECAAEPGAVWHREDRGAVEMRDRAPKMGPRPDARAPSGLAEDQLAVWRELAGKWRAEGSVEAEIAALYGSRAGRREVSL
jgi:hypothetical protein